MTENNINEKENPAVETKNSPTDSPKQTEESSRDQKGKNRRPRKGGAPQRRERVAPEFENKVISIRRVTRVVSGGRRFSFSVAIVIGNRRGKVGVGVGKASDTALAIEKAMNDAKKNMIIVPLTKNNSITHDVSAKYATSQVVIRTAEGRGITAGGAVRTVLTLAGITDIGAKIHSRSKNHLNNARAALSALSQLVK